MPQDALPEDRGDAAVSGRRRQRAAGLRGVEKAADARGLRDRLLLHARARAEAERAGADLRHARRADGLQPADRLLLCDRRASLWLAAARRGSVLLQQPFSGRVPGTERARLRRARRRSTAARTRWCGRRSSARDGPAGAMATAGRPGVPGGAGRQPRGATTRRAANRLWQFQTGAAGGPPTSYEIDGEQYIAAIAGANVWAFKLGGTLPPAAPPMQAADRKRSRARSPRRARSKRRRSRATTASPASATSPTNTRSRPYRAQGEGRHARSRGATTAGWSTRSWRRTARGRRGRSDRETSAA